MNKKFSTLVASVLLAGSLGANAADPVYSKYLGAWSVANGSYPAKMIENAYFHIALKPSSTTAPADDNGVLAVEKTNGVYSLKVVKSSTTPLVDLQNTLWTVEFLKNAEGGYSYRLKNVFANMYLSIASDGAYKLDEKGTVTPTAAQLGGEVYDWKWVLAPNPKGGFNYNSSAELKASFGEARDSIIDLRYDGTNNVVMAVKYAANNPNVTPNSAIPASTMQLVPAAVQPVVLTKDDLNSMLWAQDPGTGKLTLSFNKDVEGGNPEAVNFFTKEYKAVEAKGYPANVWGTFNNAGTPQSVTMTALATYEETKSAYDLMEAFVAALGEKDGVVKNFTQVQAAVTDAQSVTAPITFTVADKAEYIAAVAKLQETYAETPSADNKIKIEVNKAIVNYLKANIYDVDGTAVQFATVASEPGYYLTNTATNALGVSATTTTKTLTRTLENLARDLEDKEAAKDTEKENSFDKAAAENGWVSLEFDKDEKEYLMLDTAYLTGDAGKKHAAFALKDWQDMNHNSYYNLPAEDVVRKDINGRHNYQFTYYPSQDSVVIRTAGYLIKDLDPDNAGKCAWMDMEFANNTLNTAQKPAESIYSPTSGWNDEYGSERNLVKIVVLANNHREVSVGNSEYAAAKNPTRTVNTWISFHGNLTKVRTTLASGLYFFNLATDLESRQSINGTYRVAKYVGDDLVWANEEESRLLGTVQDFGHMPRTQWVVEQNPGVAGEQTVNIYNREFPHLKAENVQLYKAGNAVFADYITDYVIGKAIFASADTLVATPVMTVKPESKADKDEYLGYKFIETDVNNPLNEKTFILNYLSGIENGHFVNVSSTEKDTTIYVNLNNEKVVVELEYATSEGAAKNKYGYEGKVVPQLYRVAYVLKIHDDSKLFNNGKYVGYDAAQNIYVATKNKANAIPFFLKENNQLVAETEEGEKEITCYYALQVAEKVTNVITDAVSYPQYETSTEVYDKGRVGVADASLAFTKETTTETRVATFAFEPSKAPLYRRLGETNPEDGLKDNDVNTAKIYRINSTEKEYLYEDAQSKYSAGLGINFLGVEGKGDVKNSALFVDTAYVRGGTNMPQYMLAVDVTKVEAGKECPIDPEHNTPEYLAKHPEGCPHAVETEPYIIGRYLINAEDSVKSSVNGKKYQSDTQYTRLAFVWAKHIGDTLVILNNDRPAVLSDSIFLGNNKHNMTSTGKKLKDCTNLVDSIEASHQNGIKNAVFAFRLINNDPEADFLIETAGDKKVPSDGKGKWVAVKNGVPVVAEMATYNDAIRDAERFNIELTTDEPTANDEVEVSSISVVATNGAVIVKGAANKNVVITNVLGQQIANETVSSDNATFAAPAGVVIVAVEGEGAVKVVVK